MFPVIFFVFCFFGVFGHQCLSSPGLYPFEALAEISDFVAGLVQRVPKKPNEMKADLLNSTASQGDCNCRGSTETQTLKKEQMLLFH